jgi:hypothetical protein
MYPTRLIFDLIAEQRALLFLFHRMGLKQCHPQGMMPTAECGTNLAGTAQSVTRAFEYLQG